MKVVLYARFSPRPDEEETESLRTQLELCRAWCKIYGHEIIGEFTDAALSGKNASRPGLKEAIELVCKNKGILLSYSLSRLARNVKDCIDIDDRLKRSKAHFALVQQQIDTSSPSGRLLFHIIAAIDQYQREAVCENTSDAMIKHQARGRAMGGKPPYGWSKVGSRLVENEFEQGVIARILKLSKMCNTRQIARILTREGISPRGKEWRHATVKSVLKRSLSAKTSENTPD